MALILLLAVPLLTGTGLIVAGRRFSRYAAAWVALTAAALTAGAAGVVARQRPTVDAAWLPEVGVRLRLGVDGISIPLVLLTAVIGVLVTALATGYVPGGGSPGTYAGCLLLVEGGALATFVAGDALLFFVAFELVLVPMWVLITRFGDPHDARARADAGQRFVLYTGAGSTLMLAGILLLVTWAGTSDLSALVAAGAGLPVGRQLTVALLLTVGLAVKVPVWPLHTWLPSAHTAAPTGGSVLLAAILLKMGTYGLIRLPFSVVPEGFVGISPWLAIAGGLGILWGSLVCLVERDLKRLIAYSSVAHMGFVIIAMASNTEAGLQAALIGNLAHGVISALLFVVVGGLKERWGSVDLERSWPALREVAPHRGFALILGLAAALGLPGLAGFWGEFLAVLAAWHPADPMRIVVFRTVAVLAAVGGVLAAGYCLRVARLLWAGDAPTETSAPADAKGGARLDAAAGAGLDSETAAPLDSEAGGRLGSETVAPLDVETRGAERFVAGVLALLIITLGVAPWLVLDITHPAVLALLGGLP